MSVPRLRFKDEGGREFPDWSESPLGYVAEFLDGKRKPIKESERAKIKGEYPYYGASGIIDYVNDYTFDDEIILLGEDGENIVSRNLPLAFRVSGKCWVNNHAHVIKPNKSTNIDFLAQYLDSISYVEYNTGTAQPKLNQEICKKIPVPTPVLAEQAKIANFLTAIDEKIHQLTQKHTLLAQYKKGVMQQIFSQKLRFKDEDGGEFPEWDVVELEEIAAKVNKKNRDSAINKVLTNSATQGVVSQSDYFERDIANQNNLGGYYIVEIGDFVYNPRISANALVGPIKRNNLDVGVMSPLYTVFRFKEGNLDFVEQYFQTTHWHDYMKSVSNSGARHDRMNITNESFFGLPVPYPCEKEQTKIAKFLTAIDDKITATKEQLTSMKQYKQGLLQQMFV